MMNKFKWGGTDRSDVYLDENCLRMISNMRNIFGNLATALIRQGRTDSAKKVIERCVELFPNKNIPYDLYMLTFVESYYDLHETEKAEGMAGIILDNACEDIDYFLSLQKPFSNYLVRERQITGYVIRELIRTSYLNGDKKFSASVQQRLEAYGDERLNSIFRVR
jgi:hypothetical protein